jgi:hypothetical protein
MIRADEAHATCVARRYKTGCDLLASHMDENTVTPNDLRWLATMSNARQAATNIVGVVQRITSHQLSGGDLNLSQADLLCDHAIWDRLVAALAIAPNVWSSSPGALANISDEMRMALAKTELGIDVQRAIQADQDIIVSPVLQKAKASEMAFAETLCERGASLRVAPTVSCVALGKRYAETSTTENAAEQQHAVQRDAVETMGRAATDRETAAQDARDETAQRRETALFFSCTNSCSRGRSEQQVQDDDEQAAECSEKCGDDLTSLWKCRGEVDPGFRTRG